MTEFPTPSGPGKPLNRQGVHRIALLVVLSGLITLMIAPDLNLVPASYEEGELIRLDIIISENINLVDERSTESRRKQALEKFPPLLDFDTRLGESTRKALRRGFELMRRGLADQTKAGNELRALLRQNSLQQLTGLAEITKARDRLHLFTRLKRQVVNRIGALSGEAAPTPAVAQALEKLRFELLTIDAQRVAAEQSVLQLDTRQGRLGEEAKKRLEAWSQFRANRDQRVTRLKTEFEEAIRTPVEDSTFRVLLDAQFNSSVEAQVLALAVPLLSTKIVARSEQLADLAHGIQIRPLEGGAPERLESLAQVSNLQGARNEVNKRGREMEMAGELAAQRETMIALAQTLLRPTLTENKGETEKLKQELARSISPVYFSLKAGDAVARGGEVATAQQVEIIRALNAYNLSNPKYPQIIGSFLIVVLSLWLVYRMLGLRQEGRMLPISRLILMATLLLLPLGLAQLILLVVPALTTVYDFIPGSTYHYLIPAALTAMLGAIVLRFEAAVFLGFLVSLYLAILLGNSLSFFIYSLMGSIVAALPVRYYETRYALWQQGLRISAVNVPVLVMLSLLNQEPFGWDLALRAGAGLISGLGVAFLVSTLLPFLERAFDLTTNLRLLELSNMNQPALKELSVRAPGTYHHSIVVGNLSESAAPGISANPLLVRVASYYHDLGKMLCPLYFVENQHQKNYHDDLPAKTSARILINHVRDGLEIAKRYKLGKAIMDIIAQHHGDSLVRYFFHKARQEQADTEETLDEEDFQYPGPKPQTKEAGLVMVADITEAATRSLGDPSPEAVRELVQKVATRLYSEGELDESGMTFNDLAYIEKTFTKMLISIHHHRISYPDFQVGRLASEAPSEDDPTPRQLRERQASS